jgi:hypothetical protein
MSMVTHEGKITWPPAPLAVAAHAPKPAAAPKPAPESKEVVRAREEKAAYKEVLNTSIAVTGKGSPR